MHFITDGDTISSILYYNAQLISVPQWCSGLLWLHLLDRKSKICNVNTRVQEMYWQFTVYSTSLVYTQARDWATPTPKITNISSCHKTLYSCMLPAMFQSYCLLCLYWQSSTTLVAMILSGGVMKQICTTSFDKYASHSLEYKCSQDWLYYHRILAHNGLDFGCQLQVKSESEIQEECHQG